MLVEIKHIHPQMLMLDITVKPEKQNCWLKQNIHIHSGMRCSLHFTFNCLLVSMMSCAICSPQNSQWLLCTGTELTFVDYHSNRGTCSSTAVLNLHILSITTLRKVCSESTTTQQGSPGPGLIPPWFTYANDVKALGLGQSFQLVFVPHAGGIRVEIFQVWYLVANTWWSRLRDPIRILKVWHKIPLLITGEPAFLPFLLPS